MLVVGGAFFLVMAYMAYRAWKVRSGLFWLFLVAGLTLLV